jgi:hypothetical protein
MPLTILAATSQKGGVGKTIASCALLDCLRRRGFTIAAYDGDGANRGLSDMHATRTPDDHRLVAPQDPHSGVVTYDGRDRQDDSFVDSLEAGAGADAILHDIAGGALGALVELFDGGFEGLADVLRDVDARIVWLHLITRDDASVASCARYLQLCESAPQRFGHIAVINRHSARDDAGFPAWLGSPDGRKGGRTRARLLAGGGGEIELPALAETTMSLVRAARAPFHALLERRDISLAHRQRIRIFLRRFDGQLTPEMLARMGLGETVPA